jgi:hypothetical protein
MNRPERLRYKAALVRWLELIQPSFHVVAELPPAFPRSALLRAIRDWAARIDRYYLGRKWAKCSSAERMSGVLFFEKGKRRQWHHAHLALRPPSRATDFHFQLNAERWFCRHPDPLFQMVFPKPVTAHGKMQIDPIGGEPADRQRVLSYIAKELEWSNGAIESWLLLHGLAEACVSEAK